MSLSKVLTRSFFTLLTYFRKNKIKLRKPKTAHESSKKPLPRARVGRGVTDPGQFPELVGVEDQFFEAASVSQDIVGYGDQVTVALVYVVDVTVTRLPERNAGHLVRRNRSFGGSFRDWTFNFPLVLRLIDENFTNKSPRSPTTTTTMTPTLHLPF